MVKVRLRRNETFSKTVVKYVVFWTCFEATPSKVAGPLSIGRARMVTVTSTFAALSLRADKGSKSVHSGSLLLLQKTAQSRPKSTAREVLQNPLVFKV